MTYQQSPVYMKITKNILFNTAIFIIIVIYVILARSLLIFEALNKPL